MNDNGSKQNIRHTGRNIWIVVLILMIILIITLALMGALLGKLSGKDGNIIPLFGKTREDGASSTQAEEAPELVLQDGEAGWDADTSVDLFKAAYANRQGAITVQSADGGKVIAPGTANSYEFSLKNTGNISLDYTMRLDSAFTLTDRQLPVQVRLRSGDRWIFGGQNVWARPDALTEVEETGTLAVNKYVTYTFEWQWPYESGTDDALLLGDLNDTLIGNAAVEQEVEFRLNIGVQSVITPGATPEGVPDGEPQSVPDGPVFLGLLGIGILLLLLLLLFWRTPVYVTGFLPGEGELCIGRKRDALRPDGRFLFPKIYMGRHRLTLGEAQYRIRLKRKRKLPGLAFEEKDDLLVITVGRKVRAIELYLLPALAIRQDEWAAIDKDHNVISPTGVKEPDENRENTTPGGLHIDRDGVLEIEAFAAAK